MGGIGAFHLSSQATPEGERKRCRFGHAFMFDTGSSTGEISGHSKVCVYIYIEGFKGIHICLYR